jgi:hypothetical protein
VLDAALLVFAARGPDSASMKDIAAAAGVTTDLLYNYCDCDSETLRRSQQWSRAGS